VIFEPLFSNRLAVPAGQLTDRLNTHPLSSQFCQLSHRGKVDKARYMNMAEVSLEESGYYLILAQDLGYGDTSSLNDQILFASDRLPLVRRR
jgi:hypothetical protein